MHSVKLIAQNFSQNSGAYYDKNKAPTTSDIWLVLCLGLAPLCYLSVRSWTITFLFVLIFISASQIKHLNLSELTSNHKKSIYWVIAALVAPLVAAIAGQLFRGQIKIGLMDGPSRPFLAVFLFMYLLQKPIDFVRLLEWCIPISLIILSGVLIVHPYGWSDITSERFGTAAIDPLTLGQYTLFMAFFCLLTFNIYGNDSRNLKFLKLIGFLIGIWISLGTGSRSAWVAIPFLSLLWILGRLQIRQFKKIILIIFLLFLLGILVYETSPSIHGRIALAVNEYIDYFHNGNKDTSSGIRLSLLRLAAYLFANNPLAGYGDSNYPSLSGISSIASFNTALLETTLIHNGVHNEIMQNTLRSGIFGLLSSLLMFGVPIVIFYRATRSEIKVIQTAGLAGLCYIGAMFFFGLSTETFNMKYSISFYALMVSALAAQVLRPQPV
ncbi:hypothetical protein os1_22490 [Comamonadaceae bacterium OS-1]|nr:hypothetical protein os1_22490 [Comamonadaceae bacterium OS-1]